MVNAMIVVLESFRGTERQVKKFIKDNKINMGSVASINKVDSEGKQWILWYWRLKMRDETKKRLQKKRCIALMKNGERCTAIGVMEGMCLKHWKMAKEGKLHGTCKEGKGKRSESKAARDGKG